MKFNENRSKGSGDMEQTRNSMVNSMTLKCDFKAIEHCNLCFKCIFYGYV